MRIETNEEIVKRGTAWIGDVNDTAKEQSDDHSGGSDFFQMWSLISTTPPWSRGHDPKERVVLRSLFIFITPIILSLDLISWSYLLILSILNFQTISWTIINHSHQFHLIYRMQIIIIHISFTFVSLSSVMSYHILCTAVYSCAQPHLVVYIFGSLHWCTLVLTLSIPGLWLMLACPWLMGSPLSTDLILWFGLPNEAADPWWIVCAWAGLFPWILGLWPVGLEVDIRPVSPCLVFFYPITSSRCSRFYWCLLSGPGSFANWLLTKLLILVWIIR